MINGLCYRKLASRVLFALFAGFLFYSCASPRDFSMIDYHTLSGDYESAYNQLEQEKEALYTGKDKVLYTLDKGLLLRYSGNYEQSNTSLSNAEKLIEEYYATSITQTIGSYLLNDNVLDYGGEDFEDIYTNLFMAMNYIQLGEIDSAFVEIRRFNNKIKLLSSKYDDLLYAIKKKAVSDGYDTSQYVDPDKMDYQIEFHDSAFARYISLILYRLIGDMDSANIDKNFIETAFASQQQLYPFPIPHAVYEEFFVPEDKERVNVFFYSGKSPEKVEDVLRIPSLINDSYLKIAMPILEKNSSLISSISISAKDLNGNVYNSNLEVIESIENIIVDTFQQKQGAIYLRTLVRALAKFTTNSVMTEVARASEEDSELTGDLISLFGNLFTELSETADIRSSRYFPSYVWVGGLNLEKGLYDIVITAHDAYGKVVFEKNTTDFTVKENNINILEAICLH